MILLLAIALSVPQSTWIVDRANGPGTNYTDLPPAVAAAAHGDTIFVRRSPTNGPYSPFQVTGKALTIRGEGAAVTIVSNLNGFGASSIAAVPAGSVFCLEGINVQDLTLTNSSLAATS